MSPCQSKRRVPKGCAGARDRARRRARPCRRSSAWRGCAIGAVAIDAIDLDRIARLAVELAVAVAILLEMAVDALHPLVEMHVLQVDGLLELLGIS